MAAVLAAVRALEDDPKFNAGHGACLTSDGTIELECVPQGTLVERIRGRNRDYERDISEAYINEVNKAYNYFFFHYTQTPLLVIDTTSIDFVRHEHHLDELVEQIRKMEHGVQYYQPLGSSR